ncbi:zinc-binding alcohol dehydrogenase [Halomonas campisalis]|uniref:Zinc-binding alcohol dehydrogenase n=1 Tax=Billgrantia campisalis TaxID=74661 RepID=A0ABS9P8J0_9GAMM|nr:zinc-binding alcohol dehydrogenase [Halomonas campisalis]MCG6657532.1 zinc-binding alcohol dehydrogenase [Halomonas campisalis]MDR5863121.1 zinc-binding alcohol dehydrogenase [Halomonas campisalis]
MRDATATAYWILAPGRGALREEPLPLPASGQVEVRALYGGISRGTEALVFRGEVPVSEYARMRAPFQVGDFPGPVKYGYVSVGRVEAGDADLLGREVFCLHPHQDRYVVPRAAVVPLPEGVPAARAVLAANMETALNGLWDAAPVLGERITVIGAGVVGVLMAWLCAAMPGTRVQLVDVAPQRAGVAEALGLDFRCPEQADAERDRVIHASGSAEGLRLALTLAGLEARVVEMSWFGSREVTLPLGEAFHSRRLTLQASQVGRLPVAQRPRWDHRRRLTLALELLREARLEALISGESDFQALPELMPRLAAGAGEVLCHRLRYSSAPVPRSA